MYLTLSEFLDYAQEQQTAWQAWFAEHGDDPLAIETGGNVHRTLGALVQHALGSELWFAEQVRSAALTEWWKQPANRADGLFEIGSLAKQKLREFIGVASPEDWMRIIELSGQGVCFRITVRKAILNALMHEVRHWAQAATLVRKSGMAPPGDLDVILSKAIE